MCYYCWYPPSNRALKREAFHQGQGQEGNKKHKGQGGKGSNQATNQGKGQGKGEGKGGRGGWVVDYPPVWSWKEW